ncbi:MAG: pyridoxal phosphate-dependent aminotransferase [Pseudomonadota bacterium]
MPISNKVKTGLERGSWIRKMFEEGDRLKTELGADNVYDFSLGNPFGEPPPEFLNELKNLVNDPTPGMHRYPPNAGSVEVREAIAKVLAEDSGMDFTWNNIVMTCGAGGGLNVVLKTIIDPGDEVIVLTPFFVEYRFYIDNHNGTCRGVPTNENFDIDLEALNQAITPKTRAIIINSPNNPTGVIYSAKSLKGLEDLLKKKEAELGTVIYVVSDEPYKKLAYDNIEPPNVFKLINNSIVVTSHSKDLSIPGERIGYIAVNPIAADLQDLMNGFTFCNRIIGFVNAPALMQRVVAKLQKVTVNINDYQEKRDLFYNSLTEMGYKMVKPQGAFYLFPKSPIEDDVAFVREAQKKNILIVPGSGFGTPGYFRIAYCVEKKSIENSLPCFRELAKEYGLG